MSTLTLSYYVTLPIDAREYLDEHLPPPSYRPVFGESSASVSIPSKLSSRAATSLEPLTTAESAFGCDKGGVVSGWRVRGGINLDVEVTCAEVIAIPSRWGGSSI